MPFVLLALVGKDEVGLLVEGLGLNSGIVAVAVAVVDDGRSTDTEEDPCNMV